MSGVVTDMMPGMGDALLSSDRVISWGNINSWQLVGIVLLSSTTDSGVTPTTKLRAGQALGKITATGKYTIYAATATDGSEVPVGFLWDDMAMLDADGTAVDKQARMMICGNIKAGMVPNIDNNVRRFLAHRFIFDDNYIGLPGDYARVVNKAANYTVLAADNNTTFTVSGAATITLPTTIVRGFRIRVIIVADVAVTIAAPADTLVAFNDPTATSIAFSTASEKTGACVEIISNADETKYIAIVSLAAETQTPTIA